MPDPSFHSSLGLPFIELQTVDSTNNYALERIHAGLAQHGEAIFSHEQTAGKGQRGKQWITSKGANIVLSVIVKPAPLETNQQFQFSACVAVAVRHFFEKYAGEHTKIKWPNDLFWKDKKAGGILIESVVRSMDAGKSCWEWAVAGIGININQTNFSPELPNPVSLKQITGKNFNAVDMAKEICRILNQYFHELNTRGFGEIYTQYLSFLYKLNEIVKFKKDNRIFEATIKKVSTTGKLVVQHSIEEEFDFGEVVWIIQ